MTRDEAITTIAAMWPADSNFTDTSEIGLRLLNQARDEVIGGRPEWREEETAVLVRYAELCPEADRRAAEEIEILKKFL